MGEYSLEHVAPQIYIAYIIITCMKVESAFVTEHYKKKKEAFSNPYELLATPLEAYPIVLWYEMMRHLCT